MNENHANVILRWYTRGERFVKWVVRNRKTLVFFGVYFVILTGGAAAEIAPGYWFPVLVAVAVGVAFVAARLTMVSWTLLVRWFFVALWVVALGIYAVATIAFVAEGAWGDAAIGCAFLVLYALLLISSIKRLREKLHEHREARRDRDDSGPGSGTSTTGSAAGQGTGESPGVAPLPEKTADLPILAYKAAHVAYLNGECLFIGVGQSQTYRVEAVAECNQFAVHNPTVDGPSAPVVDCSCGFYALKQSSDVTGPIILTVELYGRVIVCEDGYRAEKQRVLSVEMRCYSEVPFATLSEMYGVPFHGDTRRLEGD